MIFYNEKFKARRLQLRYSAAELAKQCGVTRITIVRWENGVNIPSSANVRIVAGILNISASEISDLPDNNKNRFLDGIKDFNQLAKTDEEKLQEEEEDFIVRIKKQREQITKAKLVINTLLNTMHSAFYIKNTTNEYVLANNEFLKLARNAEDTDIDGKDDYYLFPQNEAEQNAKIDQSVLGLKERIVSKQMYIPGTRKKKWGLITKVPILNHQGIAEGMLCTIKDITEEKKSDELNQELRLAIGNIPDVVWTGIKVDYKFKYTTVNEAAQTLLGLTQEQFFKFEWKKHIHQDSISALEEHLKDKKTNPRQLEYKYIHPVSGKTLWLQNRINADEKYFFGIIRDITKEKEQENLQKLILQSFEKFKVAFSIFDETVNRTIFNYGSDELFKIPKEIPQEDHLSYWLNNIVHPDEREKHREYWKTNSWPEYRKYRILTKEKETKWIEVNKEKRFINNQKYEISFIRDITEQKELENLQKLILQSFGKFKVAFSIYDRNTQKAIFNSGTFALFEIPEEIPQKEHLSYWLNNIVHPDDRKQEKLYVKTQSWPKNRKYRILTKEKETRWIEVFHEKRCFDDPRYSASFMRDITEQKEGEEIRVLLENALNISNDGIWITTCPENQQSSKNLYINLARAKIYEQDIDEIMKNHSFWKKNLHPDDSERIVSESKEMKPGKETQKFRLLFSDGRVKYIIEDKFIKIVNNIKYSGGIQKEVSREEYEQS